MKFPDPCRVRLNKNICYLKNWSWTCYPPPYTGTEIQTSHNVYNDSYLAKRTIPGCLSFRYIYDLQFDEV